MNKTGIEWSEWTWNPGRGCRAASPGCANCFAAAIAARGAPVFSGYAETTEAGLARWTGKVSFLPGKLDEPLRLWRRSWDEAAKLGRRPRIFAGSMTDLFLEEYSDENLAELFAVAAVCNDVAAWRFMFLTKHPERMASLTLSTHFRHKVAAAIGALQKARHLTKDEGHPDEVFSCRRWPLPNVWLGTSIEDVPRVARVDALACAVAAGRFLSVEPLLEDVALPLQLARGWRSIDWLIAGGESGPGARAVHPNAWRRLRELCRKRNVPFWFKQWGAWVPAWEGDPNAIRVEDTANRRNTTLMTLVGKRSAGHALDGVTWDETPIDPPPAAPANISEGR